MVAVAVDRDMRRYKRIRPGRKAMLSSGRRWQDCTIVDISGGGASVRVEESVPDDPYVVLCDADLGLIAATVDRREDGRLVLNFGIDDEAKGRLIDRLTGLLNAHLL